ncbi:MAG: hypothetical protein P4L51_18295 [Puia sp.]|nr:hypothetical protein [Puia sp.]
MKPIVNFLFGLCFPVLVHAQQADRRSDIAILPQELNDQFQSLKNYLDGSDGQAKKLQQTSEEIKNRYPDMHGAPDLERILKGLESQEREIEANRIEWRAQMVAVEIKIRAFIVGANGKTVEWRRYNANPVDKLGTIITTIYSLRDDHVIAVDAYEPLPTAARS